MMFQNFYPFSFPTFCERALESIFICSLELVQPRKTHLDMTEKIVDMVLKNQNKQNNHYLISKRFLIVHKWLVKI